MKKAKISCLQGSKLLCMGILLGLMWCGATEVEAGLTGYWRFDEESGTSAADCSVNGNDATLTNMDTNSCWVAGKSGSALDFDGSNDKFSIASPSGLTGATGSIEFWMKADAVQNGTVFQLYENASTKYIRSHLNTYGWIDLVISDNNEYKTYLYYDMDNLPGGYVGKWLYVMWVQDGTQIKLYINGEQKPLTVYRGTNNGDWWTAHLSPVELRVGWGWNYYNGSIDELMVYDTVPSSQEIANRSQGRFVSAGWHFDETSGTIADDFSQNGSNNATLTNMDTGTCWVDGALEFDGVNDMVTVSNPSGLTSATGAIEFWMRADAVQSGTIFHLYENASTKYIRSHLNTYGWIDLVIEDNNEPKTYVYYDLDNLPGGYVGKWIHVMWVQDGTQVRLYINGERKILTSYSGTTNNGDWWTAHLSPVELRIGTGWNYFNGAIDDMIILNRPVSESEINDLCASVGLCCSWEFNEGAGSTAGDGSGCGNNAAFVSMAASPWVGGVLNRNGYFETALRFNNSGDYLTVNNSSSLQVNGDLTLSLWIKPTTIGVKQCSLIDKDFGGEYSLILAQDGAVKLRQGKSQSAGCYFEATVIPSNSVVNSNWQHIVVTRNMTPNTNGNLIIKGYLDGVEKDPVTYDQNSNYYPPAATTSAVTIGSGYFSDYNGDIDKVKIYSRVLEKAEISAMNLLNVHSGRSYYTTENGVAVCTLNIPTSSGLTYCSLVAKNAQGTTLATNSAPTKVTDLTFSTSTLSTGDNTITVELKRSSGERVFKRDMTLTKRAAGQWGEVKVDQKNGILLRNGSAFFPIGFYMNGIPSNATVNFQDVADAGFNSVIRWSLYVDPSDATAYLQNAGASGLSVLDSLNAYSTVNLGSLKYGTEAAFTAAYEDQRDSMIDAVGYAKQQNNLLGYYTFDEPVTAQFAAALDLYDGVNDEDGHHPVYCYYPYPQDFDRTDIADAFGGGMYWMPPRVAGTLTSSLDYAVKRIYLSKQRAKQEHKSLFATPYSESCGGNRKRAITPDEQRCQTYLAMIHGAKGIFYFVYPVKHDSLWNTLSELAGELTDLTPSLLTPDLEQNVTYSTGELNPEYDKYVDVNVSLRKAPAGAGYDYVLLAANTRDYPVTATYDISLLGSSGTVSRLFSQNTYSITNGSFSEQLPALAARAYTFSSSSTDPVTIYVTLAAGSATAETVYPITGRPGKTNMMQNPSLEDATLPSWPDYCWPWYASPRINAANQQLGLVETPDLSGLQTAIEADGGDSDGSGNPGDTCVKITKTESTAYNGFYFYLQPLHTDSNGKDYTVSVYIKKAEETTGFSVKLGSYTLAESKEYFDQPTTPPSTMLTTNWTRFTFTPKVPANVSGYNYFYIQLWGTGTGTIWVDAVQVEAGSNATEFTTN